MTLSIKILILGFFLSLLSLATGRYLDSNEKRVIASKIKNCESDIKLGKSIDRSIIPTVKLMEQGYLPKSKDLIPDSKTFAIVIEYLNKRKACEAKNYRITQENKKNWEENSIIIAIAIFIVGSIPWFMHIALPWIFKVAIPLAWNFYF